MCAPHAPLRGDEAELYTRLAARLRWYLRMHVDAPRAVIDDACMNTWAILLRRQPDRRTVWAWLKIVAVREAWTLAERERRESLNARVRDVADDPTFERAVELIGELDELRGQLEPRKCRMLLLQAAGFSYAEIARMTGETQRSVERQILGARRIAREIRSGPGG